MVKMAENFENYSFNSFLNEHSILLNDNFDLDNNFLMKIYF